MEVTDTKLRCLWITRNTTNSEFTAARISYDVTNSYYLDEGLAATDANGSPITYYYWVYSITKSGAKSLGSSVSAYFTDPTAPVYNRPEPVSDFTVSEIEKVADTKSGVIKSKVQVNFTPPNDGIWQGVRLYRSTPVGSGQLVSGLSAYGDSAGDWSEILTMVGELKAPASLLIDPDPEKSIISAVSVGIYQNLTVTGRVDDLCLDACNDSIPTPTSWIILTPTAWHSQSFTIDRARSVQRWQCYLKTTGSFTDAAEIRLAICTQTDDYLTPIMAGGVDYLSDPVKVSSISSAGQWPTARPRSISAIRTES
jgi:hypothetical protein